MYYYGGGSIVVAHNLSTTPYVYPLCIVVEIIMVALYDCNYFSIIYSFSYCYWNSLANNVII